MYQPTKADRFTFVEAVLAIAQSSSSASAVNHAKLNPGRQNRSNAKRRFHCAR